MPATENRCLLGLADRSRAGSWGLLGWGSHILWGHTTGRGGSPREGVAHWPQMVAAWGMCSTQGRAREQEKRRNLCGVARVPEGPFRALHRGAGSCPWLGFRAVFGICYPPPAMEETEMQLKVKKGKWRRHGFRRGPRWAGHGAGQRAPGNAQRWGDGALVGPPIGGMGEGISRAPGQPPRGVWGPSLPSWVAIGHSPYWGRAAMEPQVSPVVRALVGFLCGPLWVGGAGLTVIA